MPSDRALLDVLHRLRRHTGDDLDAIATRSGWSPFHLHRAFRTMVGETPKHYALRVRLERAAARLLTTDDSVLEVAIAHGFKSHEVFTRAFHRHFGRTPAAYRQTPIADAPAATRRRHRAFVESSGPCIGLYHIALDASRRVPMPTLSIERRDLAAQPFLFVRLKAGRHEIANAIAEGLGKAFPYVMQAGLPIAGRPTARYLTAGPGLFDMQVGVPVAVSSPGAGDVQAGELPGGPIAVGVHAGGYDQLGETYAAMERWMDANGYRPGGAPWESYVTDPGEFPDSKDWRTEIYWPVASI
ncbi:MAG TPA: AraC family transcriptional regulator [Vicinamibacterales bacterium]|nr:AraC family transcriptional regulator [Vicinamibacterales bacterium]